MLNLGNGRSQKAQTLDLLKFFERKRSKKISNLNALSNQKIILGL